jgi:hypothetical protein
MLRRVGLALAALLILGGSETSRPLVLELALGGTPAQLAAPLPGIVHILLADFGLPLPARITARLYAGRPGFEQGLIRYAAVPASRAATFAEFASGAAVPGLILLRAPIGGAEIPGDWPRLIAHELTHLAQIELAGTDVGPAQWLSEGMADLVASEVVDRLGLGEAGWRRAHARAAAVEYVRRSGGVPLHALSTPAGFLGHHQRAGNLVTYGLSFHLVAELASRHGFESLVRYFEAFRTSDDAAGNFAACFGHSPREFSRMIVSGLAAPA